MEGWNCRSRNWIWRSTWLGKLLRINFQRVKNLAIKSKNEICVVKINVLMINYCCLRLSYGGEQSCDPNILLAPKQSKVTSWIKLRKASIAVKDRIFALYFPLNPTFRDDAFVEFIKNLGRMQNFHCEGFYNQQQVRPNAMCCRSKEKRNILRSM